MAKKKPTPQPEPKKVPEGPLEYKPIQLSPKKPNFRFFCDSCTGIAFYSHDKRPATNPVQCENCGKEITSFPEQNYIKL